MYDTSARERQGANTCIVLGCRVFDRKKCKVFEVLLKHNSFSKWHRRAASPGSSFNESYNKDDATTTSQLSHTPSLCHVYATCLSRDTTSSPQFANTCSEFSAWHRDRHCMHITTHTGIPPSEMPFP